MKRLLSRVGRKVFKVTAQCLEKPEDRELRRLDHLPRRVNTITDLPGFSVPIPDGPSFAAIWREVFQKRIYEFSAENDSPFIIDCGANVGLSTIFFKRLYPRSHIIAFEPDPTVFKYLTQMLKTACVSDVQPFRKGVWSSTGSARFLSEGSDAGRIADSKEEKCMPIEIETIRLKEVLNKPVDFLKIDIEGAETEVLLDCADNLAVVRNLFVEYHSFANAPQRLNEILALLRRENFRVHIHPIGVSLQPYLNVQAHLGMDLQLNIFAYRSKSDS